MYFVYLSLGLNLNLVSVLGVLARSRFLRCSRFNFERRTSNVCGPFSKSRLLGNQGWFIWLYSLAIHIDAKPGIQIHEHPDPNVVICPVLAVF